MTTDQESTEALAEKVQAAARRAYGNPYPPAIALASLLQDLDALVQPILNPPRAAVVLFKASGKYYTTEKWRIPAQVPMETDPAKTRDVTGPYDMEHSPDFRRINGGAVLVESQDPWGYPFLFPGEPA